MDRTLKIGSVTAHRPSSPEIAAFLEGKFVLAGTGHRPDKLGGYGSKAEQLLVSVAEHYLNRLTPEAVISGMALGWDAALAQAALNLQLPLVAAIPFPKQASRWPQQSQQRWTDLLVKAALVVCVGSDTLADADIRAAMQLRNEFMVDHATLILSCYDGTPGGTRTCVEDAKATGLSIVNTYPEWQSRVFGDTTQPKTTAPRRVNHPEYGEGTVKTETTLRGEPALIVEFSEHHSAILSAASFNPTS